MNDISIRSLQHYLYCPHRWGLIEIDRAWAENYFVARAEILHERAHSQDRYFSRGRRVYTSVKIWHDGLGLYGAADCIEESGGIFTIVEYKPTAPKGGAYREEDLMQVFAQKLCVDNILACDCKAVMYYADTRKRVPLPLGEVYGTYYPKLLEIMGSMREYRSAGRIPPMRKGQNCSGCSMKELCIPSSLKKKSGIQKKIVDLAWEPV